MQSFGELNVPLNGVIIGCNPENPYGNWNSGTKNLINLHFLVHISLVYTKFHGSMSVALRKHQYTKIT
jgi:hypothetical protein